MQTDRLEDLVASLGHRRVPFSALMPWRIRNILLVSSLYDSFTFQEDGNLTEMLFSEYLELNLSYAPTITRVSTAEEAIEKVRREEPDLVISMLRVGESDVFRLGREIKKLAPDLPLVLLAYDTRELAMLRAKGSLPGVDRVFVWQGDVRLFLAIIKWIEDLKNARHDAETVGVKSIILIEDNVRFYSAYLPLIYTEIMEQTQALMAEGVNRMQKLMRMRARPKILWAVTYEEGLQLFRRHRRHTLGVIVDVRFPRDGASDPDAGLDFARMVKEEDQNIPVLMQSTDQANAARAGSIGAAFINKTSPTLLHDVQSFMRTYLGFGDFVFRMPDGQVVARCRDLRDLVDKLRTAPVESVLYHARRNDFSSWLMARTEFDLAKALRPRRPEEFENPGELRGYLLDALEEYRGRARAGLVEDFSGEAFDPDSSFTKYGLGSLGGKGRGLAFINSIINSYDIERQFPGVRVFVPPTLALATGVFDRFMQKAGLAELALGPAEDSEIREAFLASELPADVIEALRTYLMRVRYPLAVRSSSLLEDSSYQPFAGIFQTYMLPNNSDDIDVRLEELCRAIRLVYASTFYAESRAYIESTPNRLEEEKMAVLIQQIVGHRHGDLIYPNAAGVVRSYNYYPLEGMRPDDGVASVALGLGRMVVDGGRCVRFSPAEPRRLYQFSSTQDYLENAQREFYALDLSKPGPSLSPEEPPDANLELLGLDRALDDETLQPVGSVYSPENDAVYEGVHRKGIKLVTLAGLLDDSIVPLPKILQFLAELGKAGFSCHVEVEFALNLKRCEEEQHEFACLQIRPLVFGTEAEATDLTRLDDEDLVCRTSRALGHGYFHGIRDIVYVRRDTFERGRTPKIATEVGTVSRQLRRAGRPFLLIGPGRWGSNDPWLGIPVTWGQISGVRCVVEAEMQDIRVTPSQGTHFFQNLTSFGIGYFTVISSDPLARLDGGWLDAQPAAWQGDHVRHLALPEELPVIVDGKSGSGAILKPGRRLPRKENSSNQPGSSMTAS
ncbi:MAG: histidine kinase [Candidatus Eisenbacteria bacterium]|nr:histidine kinase [Candidatus Eisenbacteria bacterium]